MTPSYVRRGGLDSARWRAHHATFILNSNEHRHELFVTYHRKRAGK